MTNHDYISRMNAYYEARAGLHDTYMSFVSHEEMEKLLGAVIILIEKDIKGRNILEIACGTGNWTGILAKRARHVTATDISPSMLKIAREKLSQRDNVTLIESDAYRLSDVGDKYNCAFASDWWSHIPKSKIRAFLEVLHSKLSSGSSVIFIDVLPAAFKPGEESYSDADGNNIQSRVLPDGRVFEVIKNFPTKSELFELLGEMAGDIRYHRNIYLDRWILIYTVK